MVPLKKKHVLVCGAGSIGKRHIANLLQLGAEVTVWRKQSQLLASLAQEFPVAVNADLAEAISKADAVIVATATDEHVSIAAEVLKAGKALFIEKPVSHNWEKIDKLNLLAKNKIIEVGCQFRTHPNLIVLAEKLHASKNILTYRLAMGHTLSAWRKDGDYSKGYSADAGRGGGALFDLIHQIDIAHWLFGPVTKVNAVLSKRSHLAIQGDDVTNLLLTHQIGVTGHVQVDMASPVYRCEAEVITDQEIFHWSYLHGKLQRETQEAKTVVSETPPGYERNNLFIAHMQHFLERVTDHNIKPLCSWSDGVAALQTALAARESDRSGKTIEL